MDKESVAGAIFGVAQLITYVMAIVRWFVTDHYSFWHGFKELLWAIRPLANFTYVWDWWLTTFMFVWVIGRALIDAR